MWLSPNGFSIHPPQGLSQGGSETRRDKTRIVVTPTRRPRAAAAARPAVVDGRTRTQRGHYMVNDVMHLFGRRGGQATWGGVPRKRRSGEQVQNAHRTPQGRQGARNSAVRGGGWRILPRPHHNRDLSTPEWGSPPPKRKTQTCRASPLLGKPVVAKILWRLPSPQLWEAPIRGIPG